MVLLASPVSSLFSFGSLRVLLPIQGFKFKTSPSKSNNLNPKPTEQWLWPLPSLILPQPLTEVHKKVQDQVTFLHQIVSDAAPWDVALLQ